ncbi:hypothetical protein J7I93_03820 [Bacillus sp. ISL-47]|uniref:hypothetical protein n=1 Tax=Bacillus sp. ISL-47 TaxID=2819130 RepID=UPI001BEA2C82|nr:hypothetical protein [Bacillus sp. ISL-47]MBT2687305.1 hypothetical protein [Bacillus sp. ISL-47]
MGFIIPANEGKWSFSKLRGELGELAAGKIAGRENDEEINFSNQQESHAFTPLWLQNFYEIAIQEGVGTKVEI